MSTTPSQPGTGGAGGAVPRKPAAYPTPKHAGAPAAAGGPAGAAAPTASAPARPAGHTQGRVAPPAPSAPTAPPPPTSKSASGPPAKPAKPNPFSKRNLIAGGSAAAALIALIALLMWRPWEPKPPRLNEQPYKIAQFAATSGMDRLPWSQQREYMNVLDSKDEAIRIAYKDGRLSDQEFRRALQLGWYGKHMDRMDKYFSRPPAMRAWYIDEKVLGKKYKKIMPAGHPGSKKEPKPKKDEEKSDDASPLKPEEIDRDNSTEEADMKKWPGDVRAKWMEYRARLTERKEFFKEQDRLEKEKRKASAEASAKAKPPGTAPTTGAATDAASTPAGDAGTPSPTDNDAAGGAGASPGSASAGDGGKATGAQ